jgi:hypothetical protein
VIPKRKFILPVAGLAVGITLYAVTGPVPLAHKSGTAKVDPHLAAMTAANGGKTMEFGPCKGTAGRANLLTNFSPNPTTNSGSYTATYNGTNNLACYVWVVNGSATNDTGSGGHPVNLSHAVNLATDTVTLFVVNSDTGGHWDQHTWGPAQYGNCKATGSQTPLLTSFSPNPSTNSGSYSATYNGANNLACYVWVVNGVATSDTGSGGHPVTLTHPVVNKADTVTLFVVNSDSPAHWDQHTWGTAFGAPVMTFSPTCVAHHSPEGLLFNPSPFQQPVSITYQDEATPTCWVWVINGSENDTRCSPPTGSEPGGPKPVATTRTYSCTLLPGDKKITLEIVDGDHGGDYDQYTWFPGPACVYPPGQATITAKVNNKGEVSGVLSSSAGCPVGAGHIIRETLNNATVREAKTGANGGFKFKAAKASNFPVTISFNGDATVSSAAPKSCPSYNSTCT